MSLSPEAPEKAEILVFQGKTRSHSAIPGVDYRSDHLHCWPSVGLEELASLLAQVFTLSSSRVRQLSRVQSTAGTRAEPFLAAQPYLFLQ